MKLYGGNGHRVSRSGRDDPHDETYDYYFDPQNDPRRGGQSAYTSRNGYDPRYAQNADPRYAQDYDPRYTRQNADPRYTAQNGYAQQRRAAPPPQPPKKKKSGWKTFGIIMLVLAILVGGAYAYWMISTKAPTKARQSLGNSTSPQTTDLDSDQSEAVSGSNDRYYTMLIVGKDVAGLNTDTMMLCRYDSVDHKLNVCSLPRDTLTNIPAGNKKLNNAYGYSSKTGDIEKLLDSVEDIAGFRPDSYVLIDTDTFVKMIDAMGGVDFDVPVDMNYEDFVQNLYIHINKGYQHLNGTQTMQVFRFRHTYSNGDLGRIDVQHDLIKACASQWLQLGNWNKLLPAAKIVLDNAKTNLSYGNMQWYAKEFFKMSADDISFMTVPNTGCYIRRYSYVSINVDEWMTMVNTYLNPTDTPITKENCNILYQIRPEGNSTSISAANYAVTNGGEVAGGINSFEINKY